MIKDEIVDHLLKIRDGELEERKEKRKKDKAEKQKEKEEEERKNREKEAKEKEAKKASQDPAIEPSPAVSTEQVKFLVFRLVLCICRILMEFVFNLTYANSCFISFGNSFRNFCC